MTAAATATTATVHHVRYSVMWINGPNPVWTSLSARRITRTQAAYVATDLTTTRCARARRVRRAMAVRTTRAPVTAASRSSIPAAEPDACDHAATGSGSQEVNCWIVAWTFRADASHGGRAAPLLSASAV